MNAHLYLRASTKDQDANRAKAALQAFASDKGLTVAGIYAENISGTKLDRPQLLAMLEAAEPGDICLCESVDRLTRLSQSDWKSLKASIDAKGLRLVIADLPTSHLLVQDTGITGQIMDVVNGMLIDLMATMARLDQEKRVERIRQGIQNKQAAEPDWKPTGKSKNADKWNKVESLLAKYPQASAEEVAKMGECGVATVYRIKRTLKA